jgi:hypothetical protein
MPLRKSPTLPFSLLASNRPNAKQSIGPRTARGRAWSRLNHLKEGWRSPEYIKDLAGFATRPSEPGGKGLRLIQDGRTRKTRD